jgi:signal transduction histidine kinase
LGRLARSVRFRITAIAALAVAVILIVAGFVLLSVQRGQLTDNLDAGLARRADDLTSAGLIVDDPPLVLTNLAGDDAVVQLVDRSGVVVAGTANAIDVAPIGPTDVEPGTDDVVTTVSALPVEDDQYRILSRAVTTSTGDAVLHVATNTDEVNAVVAELRTALLVVIPLAIAVISAIVWWLVGRTLRPVESIRTEVASIDVDDLDRRVPEPRAGDEITRLATTMNAMLGRLATATRQQQRFVADASHELRSPLTRLRAEIELARAGVAGSGLDDDLAAELIADVDHLARLVDDLLHLARSDAREQRERYKTLDLDDIVLEEAREVRATASSSIDGSAVSGAALVGDAGQLRRMVRNLLDNAVRHATSRVELSLIEDGGVVRLTVTDDGPGIPAGRAEEVFDRFVRIDDARTRGTGGTGLGLAIARDIAERHGGSIELDGAHAGGARFVVVLPAAAA